MSSLADAVPICIHLNVHEEAKIGNEQDRIGMGMRKVGMGTSCRCGNELNEMVGMSRYGNKTEGVGMRQGRC